MSFSNRRPLTMVLPFLLLLGALAGLPAATGAQSAGLASGPGAKHIVSLAPSITETLFALGLGGQVVGVTDDCFFPSEVKNIPKIGNYYRPNIEAIVRLKPDLVIFYHELNDYLPSTIRDTRLTEVETLQTDRQLYRSWLHKTNRILLDVCAVYRFLAFHYSRGRLERLAASRPETGLRANPLAEIGFPENMVSAVANPSEMTDKGSRLVQRFAPEILGRRVSEEERRENLEELLSLCRRNGIRLVLIHPAYVLTLRHECLLTRFCRERSVPMFEAFDSLHHESEEPDFFFVDNFHPSPLGHANLARNLASFVLASFPDLRGGTAASSAGIVPASGWISPDPVPAGGR